MLTRCHRLEADEEIEVAGVWIEAVAGGRAEEVQRLHALALA
jgi:hypothetical protein